MDEVAHTCVGAPTAGYACSVIYVAGGLYGVPPNEYFALAHPGRGDPYVTLDSAGVPLTSHHACVYEVEESVDGFILKLKRPNFLLRQTRQSAERDPLSFKIDRAHRQHDGLARAIAELKRRGRDAWRADLFYQA